MPIQSQNILSQLDFDNNRIIIEEFQNLWKKKNDGTCGVYEDAIKDYIIEHSQNTNFNQVLIKCTLINRLYSTRISLAALIKIANQIVREQSFDQSLKEGKLESVDAIRQAPGTKDNFAFATKYCALHKNEYYPIFDSLSVETLWIYNETSKYTNEITETTLEDFKKSLRRIDGYSRYIKIYDDFIKSFGLSDYNYRQVDKYLWTVLKD